MINLLPSAKKAEIRAARTNVILIRYIVIILLATSFILGATYVTRTVLTMTKENSEKVIASNDLNADVYSATKAEVDNLSASVAQTNQLLGQEVLYSKVFISIGQIMPSGTIFDKLVLDSSSFSGTPVTTKIYAKSTAEATALQTAFKSSAVFSSVTFQPIVETGSTVEGYPVHFDATFTLNKGVTP
jgi:hypothetical protein